MCWLGLYIYPEIQTSPFYNMMMRVKSSNDLAYCVNPDQTTLEQSDLGLHCSKNRMFTVPRH